MQFDRDTYEQAKRAGLPVRIYAAMKSIDGMTFSEAYHYLITEGLSVPEADRVIRGVANYGFKLNSPTPGSFERIPAGDRELIASGLSTHDVKVYPSRAGAPPINMDRKIEQLATGLQAIPEYGRTEYFSGAIERYSVAAQAEIYKRLNDKFPQAVVGLDVRSAMEAAAARFPKDPNIRLMTEEEQNRWGGTGYRGSGERFWSQRAEVDKALGLAGVNVTQRVSNPVISSSKSAPVSGQAQSRQKRTPLGMNDEQIPEPPPEYFDDPANDPYYYSNDPTAYVPPAPAGRDYGSSTTTRSAFNSPAPNWSFLQSLRSVRYKGQNIPVRSEIQPLTADESVVQYRGTTPGGRTFFKRIERVEGGYRVDGRVIQHQQMSAYGGKQQHAQETLLSALRSAMTYQQGVELSEHSTIESLQRTGQRAFYGEIDKFPGMPRNWQTDLVTEGGETWQKWSPAFMARMFTGTQIRTKPGERRNPGEWPGYEFPQGMGPYVSRGSETGADAGRLGRWLAWPVAAFRASSEMFAGGSIEDPRFLAGFDKGKAAKRLQIGAQEMFPLMGKRIVESPFQMPGVPLPGQKDTSFIPPRERGQVIRAAVLMGGMLPEGMGQVNLPATYEERFKTTKMPYVEGQRQSPILGKIGQLAGRYSRLALGQSESGASIEFRTGDWDVTELLEQSIDQNREGTSALISRLRQMIRTGNSTTSFKSQGMKALEIGGTLPGQIGVEGVYPSFKNPVGFAHGVLSGFARGTEQEQAYFAELKSKYGFGENWDMKSSKSIMGAAQEAISAHTQLTPFRVSIHESLLEAQGLRVDDDGKLVPIRGGGWEFDEDAPRGGRTVNFGGHSMMVQTKAGFLGGKQREGSPGVWDVALAKPAYVGPMLRQARREYQGRQPFIGFEELQHIEQQLSPEFAMQLRKQSRGATGPLAQVWQAWEASPWRGRASRPMGRRFNEDMGQWESVPGRKLTSKDLDLIAARQSDLEGSETDPIRRKLLAMSDVLGDTPIQVQLPKGKISGRSMPMMLPSAKTMLDFTAVDELGTEANPFTQAYAELMSSMIGDDAKVHHQATKKFVRSWRGLVGSQEFQRKLGGAVPKYAFEGPMGADLALGPRQVVYSDEDLARLAGITMEDGGYDKRALKSFKKYVEQRAEAGDPVLSLLTRRPTSHAQTQFGMAVAEVMTQKMGRKAGMTARDATVISPWLAALGKGDVDADRFMSLLLTEGDIGYVQGGRGDFDTSLKRITKFREKLIGSLPRTIKRKMHSGYLLTKDIEEHVPSYEDAVWQGEVSTRLKVKQKLNEGARRKSQWDIQTPDWAKEIYGKDLVSQLEGHFRDVGGATGGVFSEDTPWWNEMRKWMEEQQDWSRFTKLRQKGSWSKLKSEGGVLESLSGEDLVSSYQNEMLNKDIAMSGPYNIARALRMIGADEEAVGAFSAVGYQFGLDKALGMKEGQGPTGLKNVLSMWRSYTPYGGRSKTGSYAKLFSPYKRQGLSTDLRAQWKQNIEGPGGLVSEIAKSMSDLARPNENYPKAPMQARHVAQLLYGSDPSSEQIRAVESGNAVLMMEAGGGSVEMLRRPGIARAIAASRAASAQAKGYQPSPAWQEVGWDELAETGNLIRASTRMVSRSLATDPESLVSGFYSMSQLPGSPNWLTSDIFAQSGMAGTEMLDPDQVFSRGGPTGEDMIAMLNKGELVLDEYASGAAVNMLQRIFKQLGSDFTGTTQSEFVEVATQKGLQQSDVAFLRHAFSRYETMANTQPQQTPSQKSPSGFRPWAKPVSLGNAPAQAVPQQALDLSGLADVITQSLSQALPDAMEAGFTQMAKGSAVARSVMGKMIETGTRGAAGSTSYTPSGDFIDLLELSVNETLSDFWTNETGGLNRATQLSSMRGGSTMFNQLANITKGIKSSENIPGQLKGLTDAEVSGQMRAVNRITEEFRKAGRQIPQSLSAFGGMVTGELTSRQAMAADALGQQASVPMPEVSAEAMQWLNRARPRQLQALTGVGPVLSDRITDRMSQIRGLGGMKDPASLMNIKGIGEAGARSIAGELGKVFGDDVIKEAERLTSGIRLTNQDIDKARETFKLLGSQDVKDRAKSVGTDLGSLSKTLGALVAQGDQYQQQGQWAASILGGKDAQKAFADLTKQAAKGRAYTPGQYKQLNTLMELSTMATPPGGGGMMGFGPGGISAQDLADAAGTTQIQAILKGQTGAQKAGAVAQNLFSEFSIGGTAFRLMAVNRLFGQPVQQWQQAAAQYAGAQAQFGMAMGGNAGAIMSTPLGQLQAYQARVSAFQAGMGESSLMAQAGMYGMLGSAFGQTPLQTGRTVGAFATPIMGGLKAGLTGGMISAAIGSAGALVPGTLGGIMTGIGAAAGPIGLGIAGLTALGMGAGHAYQMGEPANVYRELTEMQMGLRERPSFMGSLGFAMRGGMSGEGAGTRGGGRGRVVVGDTAQGGYAQEIQGGWQEFQASPSFEIAKATIAVENMEISGVDPTGKMELASMLEFAGATPADFYTGKMDTMMQQLAPVAMMGGANRMMNSAIQAAGALGMAPGRGLMQFYEQMPQTEVGQANFVTAAGILGGSFGQLGQTVGTTQLEQIQDIMGRLSAGESTAQIAMDYGLQYGTTRVASAMGYSAGSTMGQRIGAAISPTSPGAEATIASIAAQFGEFTSLLGMGPEQAAQYFQGLQEERDAGLATPGGQARALAARAGALGTESAFGFIPGSLEAQALQAFAPTTQQGQAEWMRAQQYAGSMYQFGGGQGGAYGALQQTQQWQQMLRTMTPQQASIAMQQMQGMGAIERGFGVMGGFATEDMLQGLNLSPQQYGQMTSMAQFASGQLGYSMAAGGWGGGEQLSQFRDQMGMGLMEGAQSLYEQGPSGGIYGIGQLGQRSLSWSNLLNQQAYTMGTGRWATQSYGGQTFQMGLLGNINMAEMRLANFQEISGMQEAAMDRANDARMLSLRQALESANLSFRQGKERLNLGYEQGQERAETGYRQATESMALSRQMWGVNVGFQREQMATQWNQMMQQRSWGREDMALERQLAGREFEWGMEDANRAIRFATGRQKQELIRQKERAEERFVTSEQQRDTKGERQEQVWANEEAQFAAREEHFETIKTLETEQFELQAAHLEENYTMQTEHMDENFEQNMRHMTESHEMQVRHIREQMAISQEIAALQKAIWEKNREMQETEMKYRIAQMLNQKEYYEQVVFPNQRTQQSLQDQVQDAYAKYLRQQVHDMGKGGSLWDAWDGLTDDIKAKVKEIQKLVNGIVIPEAPSNQGVPDGDRAVGGGVYANSTYLVGEQGPELFVPSSNGRIVPNFLSMAAVSLGNQGGGMSIGSMSISISIDGGSQDPRQIADAVWSKLETEINNLADAQQVRGSLWT